jgi:uncharacterized membrane protein YphA (DoxX/SURF4 family)
MRLNRSSLVLVGRTVRHGQTIFVAAILGFGLELGLHLLTSKVPAPGPPWVIADHQARVAVAIGLLVTAACLATGRATRLAAAILALIVFIRVAVYVPLVLARLHDPRPWTSAMELVAIGSAAATLIGNASASWAARHLFALSLVVFGIQHVLYAQFIAGLVPSWIPSHLFWAYFVGVAFFAAATALVTGIQSQLACTLLGAMFFAWVVFVHAPRILATPSSGDEWTSGLVALAMAGGAWLVAGTARR